MKEQENFPEARDKMEVTKLSYREFRVMIMKILNSMKKVMENKKVSVRNKECNI